MPSDHVVHPSEIIDGKKKRKQKKSQKKERQYHVGWLRFLARMFDYALLFFVLHLFQNLFLEGRQWISGYTVPLELILWIPIESLFLTLSKKTPGKFLLKLTVTNLSGRALPYKQALSRSFSVWIRGMGLGLYFIPIFTMLNALSHLTRHKNTTWDRDERSTVTHQLLHPIRVISSIVFILAVLIYVRYY